MSKIMTKNSFQVAMSAYSLEKICLMRSIGTIHRTPLRVIVQANTAMPQQDDTWPSRFGVSFMPINRQKVQYHEPSTDVKTCSSCSTSECTQFSLTEGRKLPGTFDTRNKQFWTLIFELQFLFCAFFDAFFVFAVSLTFLVDFGYVHVKTIFIRSIWLGLYNETLKGPGPIELPMNSPKSLMMNNYYPKIGKSYCPNPIKTMFSGSMCSSFQIPPQKKGG